MTHGQTSGLAGRTCRLPDCDTAFTPHQSNQWYCSPGHVRDASRMKRQLKLRRLTQWGTMVSEHVWRNW